MRIAINLLPSSYRRQTMLRWRVVQWGTVLCVALSALGLMRWYKLTEYHLLSQQLEAIAREGRPAQTMIRQITDMREKVAQLQQHEAVAQELEGQRPVLALLGVVSQAAQQSAGKLRVTDMQVVDLQSTHANVTDWNDDTQIATVTLTGTALDSPAVAEFLDALVRSGLFAAVELGHSNERPQDGALMFDYQVRSS